jgi:hypothetical protein
MSMTSTGAMPFIIFWDQFKDAGRDDSMPETSDYPAEAT